MKLHNASEKLVDATLTGLARITLHGAREYVQKGGYRALADKLFEDAGIRPKYLAEQRPEFNEWRERLKTESGLVIANHPGGVDIPAILKTLDRKDVYFISADKNIERVKGLIDQDHLLLAAKNVGQLRGMLRRAEEVLNTGALVFLFPTGGIERIGGPFEFKGGFSYLLKMLKPEQMVYAFHIVPEDVETIFPGTLRGVQMGAAMMAGKVKLHGPRNTWPTVRIDERYTTADVWQQSLSQVPGSQATKNERLAKQYLDLFTESSSE